MKVGLRERHKENENIPTRVRSSFQEMMVAKALGGSVNKNSGATMFEKGDCQTDKFLIECKTKMKHSESISVKKEWIEKNKQEALFMGKEFSAIAFNFGPDEENYYIIDEVLMKTLMEYLNHN